MSKIIKSVFMVMLLLIVSLSPIIELVDQVASVSSSEGTNGRTEDVGTSAALSFYKDGNGIIWMFTEVGVGVARITGVHFGECDVTENITTLKVPGEVVNNVNYNISGEPKKLSWVASDQNESLYRVIQIGEFIVRNETFGYTVLEAIGIESKDGLTDTASKITETVLGNVLTLVIPSSVEEIDKGAFYIPGVNTGKVQSIVFEEGSLLKSVGARAFFGFGGVRDEATITNGSFTIEQSGTGVLVCENVITSAKLPFDGKELKITIPSEWWKTYTIEGGNATGAERIFCVVMRENGTPQELDFSSKNLTITVDLEGIKEGSDIIVKLNKTIRVDGKRMRPPLCSISFISNPYDGVSVVLPDSLDWVGPESFNRVTNLTISENSSLRVVNSKAFGALEGTSTVILPSTIEKIYRDSFGSAVIDFQEGSKISNKDGNILEDLGNGKKRLLSYCGSATEYSFTRDIATSITEVADGAFVGSAVSSITLRSGISWGTYPFDGLSLTSIDFNDVKDIPDYCLGKISFNGTLTIPKQIESIGDNAFFLSKISAIEFEGDSNILTIGKYAFAHNTDLKSISFGSGHSGCSCLIDEGAFFGCNKLSTITIDESFVLTSIGDYAFAKCGDQTVSAPPTLNRTSDYKLGDMRVGTVGAYVF